MPLFARGITIIISSRAFKGVGVAFNEVKKKEEEEERYRWLPTVGCECSQIFNIRHRGYITSALEGPRQEPLRRVLSRDGGC